MRRPNILTVIIPDKLFKTNLRELKFKLETIFQSKLSKFLFNLYQCTTKDNKLNYLKNTCVFMDLCVCVCVHLVQITQT